MAEQLLNQAKGGGSIPTSPLQFIVREIPSWHSYEWLLKKHYAHRIPSVHLAYGLLDLQMVMQGVCTFGYPPNYEFNDGKCVFKEFHCTVLELNRLCVTEGLPKNTLSFFVAKCLRLIPIRPLCVVSYSDPNWGHHGYIYQALSFIYTGVSTGKQEYQFEDGSTFDIRRGLDRKGKIVGKRDMLPTHRYLRFLGSREEVATMMEELKWPISSYPKGDNKRYDADYEPTRQGVLI